MEKRSIEKPCAFRFEDFEIWQRAADLADRLCNMADSLEERRRFKFADQLRGAVLSISNNIAEGSGSTIFGGTTRVVSNG